MSRIPILFYHKINYLNPKATEQCLYVRPEDFEKQMNLLKKWNYMTVSLDEVIASTKRNKEFPQKPVVITFDDGYLDNYTYAFPIMKNLGFTGTVFLTTDAVGKTMAFDESKEKIPDKFMSWEDAKKMMAFGFNFGSHSCTHKRMTKLTDEEAWDEITKSKQIIEENLSQPVKYFCYPYGDYNENTRNFIAQAGYKGACTTKRGMNHTPETIFELRRIPVKKNTNMLKFVFSITLKYINK